MRSCRVSLFKPKIKGLLNPFRLCPGAVTPERMVPLRISALHRESAQMSSCRTEVQADRGSGFATCEITLRLGAQHIKPAMRRIIDRCLLVLLSSFFCSSPDKP